MKKDSIKKKKNLMIYEMQKEKQTELQMITGFETLMITAVFFFFSITYKNALYFLLFIE